MLVEEVKLSQLVWFMHNKVVVYGVAEHVLLAFSMLVLPVLLFPFFYDWGYYSEYQRLANIPLEDNIFSRHTKVVIAQIGRRERNSLFLAGLVLFIVELVVLFTF